jgi:hypothetical protein
MSAEPASCSMEFDYLHTLFNPSKIEVAKEGRRYVKFLYYSQSLI